MIGLVDEGKAAGIAYLDFRKAYDIVFEKIQKRQAVTVNAEVIVFCYN